MIRRVARSTAWRSASPCGRVVAANQTAGPPPASDRVVLVQEDDRRRRRRFRLGEQVAHAGGAAADDHLDELGAGHREEGRLGLPRHGPRQQGLAGARWPVQQHAFGHPAAEAGVLLGRPQEIHDLDQVVLPFVDTGHIGNGRPRRRCGLVIPTGAALAQAEHAAGRVCPLPRDPPATAAGSGDPVCRCPARSGYPACRLLPGRLAHRARAARTAAR